MAVLVVLEIISWETEGAGLGVTRGIQRLIINVSNVRLSVSIVKLR